jgi:pimeloyl-ACP methyl ester carboxylesterase
VHRQGFVPIDAETFAVITQFYEFDLGLPLDARVVEKWESDLARFEKVVFTTQSGERVPGDLALPKQGEPPFPCVFLLHGLGTSRDRWWREDREALPLGLLEAGIAVFAIDLRFHGERSAENDYQSPVFLTLGDSLFIRNRDMVIQSTIDSRRGLSYLRTREDIDDTRIGVLGYSMGGMIALFLSALEGDLGGIVASAVPTWEQPPPIDHFNFAPRTTGPTLLQFGRSDWLSSPEDAKTLLELMPTGRRELVFYNAGHELPTTFASDAAVWLRTRLR